MKAIEVTGIVNKKGQLCLDEPLAVTKDTHVKVIILVSEEQDNEVRDSPTKQEEDITWLESDLSSLGKYEPYEWQPEELEQGLPIKIDPEQGLVIVEE